MRLVRFGINLSLCVGGTGGRRGSPQVRQMSRIARGARHMTMARPDMVTELRSFAIFSVLDDSSLSQLAAAMTRRTWTAGSTIFLRGDDETHLLALLSGKVRLSLGTPQGKELVLRHLGPGEILGEMALLDGRPRSADAAAVGQVTALVLRSDRFHKIASENPAISLALARYLCGLLRDTNGQMESIALYEMPARLVRFLLFTLRQVHGDDLPACATIRLGFSQSELASIVGATRPKVNRALQDIMATGAVRRDGDALVCDVPALLELAGTQDEAD